MFKWIIKFLELEICSRKEIVEDIAGVVGEGLKDQQRAHIAEIEKAITVLRTITTDNEHHRHIKASHPNWSSGVYECVCGFKTDCTKVWIKHINGKGTLPKREG